MGFHNDRVEAFRRRIHRRGKARRPAFPDDDHVPGVKRLGNTESVAEFTRCWGHHRPVATTEHHGRVIDRQAQLRQL